MQRHKYLCHFLFRFLLLKAKGTLNDIAHIIFLEFFYHMAKLSLKLILFLKIKDNGQEDMNILL